MRHRHEAQIRLGALALSVSGILFVAFPAIRPFGDASSDPLVVAETFASTSWIVAHSLGMMAFLLLSVGLYGLSAFLEETQVGRRALIAFIVGWIGAGLTLPFFGAEAFGLQVIGQQAIARNSSDVLAVANSVRFGPGLGFITAGLLLVAIAAILSASAVWSSGTLPRWSAIPFGLGLAPYFLMLSVWALVQLVRVADGVLIAAGAIWMAAGMRRGVASS